MSMSRRVVIWCAQCRGEVVVDRKETAIRYVSEKNICASASLKIMPNAAVNGFQVFIKSFP